MSRRGRVIWVLACLLAAAGLSYLVWTEVFLAAPDRFVWVRGGETYRLVAPRMLAVAAIAPWFAAVLPWTLADLPLLQRILSAGLRTLLLAVLAFALARPVRTATRDHVALVALVDVSDSITIEGLKDAEAIVAELAKHKRPDDVLKVVTFARRPRLLGGPFGGDTVGDSPGDQPGSPGKIPIVRHGVGEAPKQETPLLEADRPSAGSNLQAAMQLAEALIPPGMLRRTVLISDGLQTDGDILSEVPRARSQGMRVHTIVQSRPPPAEVAVQELRIPDRVRVGETFTLTAEIYASQELTATARLFQGETLNGLDGFKKLKLMAGANTVEFKSVVRVPGELTYALNLDDISDDRFAENNRVSTTINVPGRPQVLYIEGSPQHGGPLGRALTAQQYDVDMRPPSGFPVSLKELERYDFFVLSDTPRSAVSEESQELVRAYVRDLGGGFLFAGGANGFGLGGWAHTPMEKLLPVKMETERRKEMPSVAMILVMDRSGSMQGLPIEMAKKAARATVNVLAPDDLIEVVAFDDTAVRYVKMQPARKRSRIGALISRIRAGAGTNIFSGLDAAYNDMAVTQARKKHVILLTDGVAPKNGIRDLVTAMIAESITVTTVGLGDGVDEATLRMIADVGGGRFHAVPDAESLPRIFTKETEMIARSAAVEEWFPVEQTGNASFLKRIDVRSAPFLHGYVATKMKPSPAVQLLASSDTDEPILARWRVGTGWALAWTSDVKTRWAGDWVRWRGWEKFWGQLVREHMRQKNQRELELDVSLEGGVMVATVDAYTLDERFDNRLESDLTVIGPAPSKKAVTGKMRQVAPGRYEARIPLSGYGSFVVKGIHRRPDATGDERVVAQSSGQVANPYPREYASFAPDVATLKRLATGTSGEFIGAATADAVESAALKRFWQPSGEKTSYDEELWSRALMLAIALFLLDLLLRRIRLFDRKFRRPSRV